MFLTPPPDEWRRVSIAHQRFAQAVETMVRVVEEWRPGNTSQILEASVLRIAIGPNGFANHILRMVCISVM